MSFTEPEIVHTFKNADRTPASGAIEFTLEQRVTNSGETIVPSSITANLNASGELKQKLTSTEDAGTVPSNARWRVDFRLLGDAEQSFFIKVPPGSGTVNLSTLLPTQPLGG